MLKKRQAAAGILVWVLIFGAFVTLAGVGDFVETLGTISGSQMGLIFAALFVSVAGMGTCLYVITRNLGIGFGPVESIFLNTSVSLAHNLTPFGQAGGAPIGAAILSQRTDSNYEECLAALSMKDVVSFVPAILVFVFGGAYMALFARSIPSDLRPLFAAFALFVVVVVGVVLAVRLYPEYMQAVLRRFAGVLNRIAARLPLVPSFEPPEVTQRVDSFTSSVGQIASDKVTVVLASALATSAFVSQGLLLWTALTAVGIDISVALAVFIVPVSLLASGLPLPGGSGGVEAVMILMVVTTTGAASTPTITAVVLSRGLVYWTPIVLGSLTLLAYKIENVFD